MMLSCIALRKTIFIRLTFKRMTLSIVEPLWVSGRVFENKPGFLGSIPILGNLKNATQKNNEQ
jgi:hypothetical protein